MGFGEALIQFTLAGGSVVAATIVGRRVPYLGAIILLFPTKVLATLIFFPANDKALLSHFLVALIPGLLAVAAFALTARWALNRMSAFYAFGIGLIAWGALVLILALVVPK